jgi:hypothetical protein
MSSGDPLKRVLPGEPFAPSAASWNSMLDAARKIARMEAESSGASGLRISASEVLVKNTTGAARSAGDIVGLGAPLIGPSDNLSEFRFHLAMIGATPAATHIGRFGVLVEAIPTGAIGRAAVAGLAVCKVNASGSGDFADVKVGDATQLELGGAGSARVVWREAGTTGSKWAVVRLAGGASGPFLARVVSSTVITAAKSWLYQVRRVTATTGGVFTDVVGAVNESAVNGAENRADAAGIYGVGMRPPAGVVMERMPIEPDVVVTVVPDPNGVNVFSMPNGYEAVCG